MPGGGTLEIQSEEYLVEDPSDRKHRPYPTRRKGDPRESDYLHLRKADPISVFLTKFSEEIDW